MRARGATFFALMVSALASALPAQVATQTSPVTMVRCLESSDVPCLSATVSSPEEARASN